MSPIAKTLFVGAFALTAAAACAVRLGGPTPQEYRTVALDLGATPPPAAQVAERIRQTDAKVVLIAANADSAWFADLATQTKLELSGPGRAGEVGLAFLATKPLGDTTIALPVTGGTRLILHDALYQVDKSRFLDLLAARVEPGTDLREAVRSLLSYVATDVMHNAAVVLAVDVVDPAVGDTVSTLLTPIFTDARNCARKDGAQPNTPRDIRLFYGPEARIRCESAQVLAETPGSPLVARLVIGR